MGCLPYIELARYLVKKNIKKWGKRVLPDNDKPDQYHTLITNRTFRSLPTHSGYLRLSWCLSSSGTTGTLLLTA